MGRRLLSKGWDKGEDDAGDTCSERGYGMELYGKGAVGIREEGGEYDDGEEGKAIWRRRTEGRRETHQTPPRSNQENLPLVRTWLSALDGWMDGWMNGWISVRPKMFSAEVWAGVKVGECDWQFLANLQMKWVKIRAGKGGLRLWKTDPFPRFVFTFGDFRSRKVYSSP